MNQSEKGKAGADAGTEDAEPRVSLGFEPAEGTADVEDGLTIGLKGEADIGGDEVVGPGMVGNGAAIMIGQAELDGGDSEKVEVTANGLLFFPARIPLSQNDYSGARGASGKILGADKIIFRPGGCDSAREGEDIFAVERVVRSRSGRVPLGAMGQSLGGPFFEEGAGVAGGSVDRPTDMLEAPGKREAPAAGLLVETHLFVGGDLL